MSNYIKDNWPRHDLPSFKKEKVRQSAKLLNIHPVSQFWKAAQGQKQWGVHRWDSFREQQRVGGEWKDNITKKNTKFTDKERRTREKAGGGGESSEIRVTLRHSGTCSAYKLRQTPKVCHWVISPLSPPWWLGLDFDRVFSSAGPRCSLNSECLTWLACFGELFSEVALS